MPTWYPGGHFYGLPSSLTYFVDPDVEVVEVELPELVDPLDMLIPEGGTTAIGLYVKLPVMVSCTWML